MSPKQIPQRISAFLLCLALLLSLSPTAAMADDTDGSPAPGKMYTSWNAETQTVEGEIGLGEVGGLQGYIIPESANSVAYYICDADTAVRFANGLVSTGEWELGEQGFKVYTLEPRSFYYRFGELRVNNYTYRVQFEGQDPIKPDPPEGGSMYAGYVDSEPAEKLEYRDITEELGDENNWTWGYVVPESANGGAYFRCNDGWTCVEQENSDGRTSLKVEPVEGSENIYKITPGEAYGRCGDFRLRNEELDNSEGVAVIFDGYDPNVINHAHPVQQNERVQPLASEDDYGPVSFTYDGETYYMGILGPGGNQPSDLWTITGKVDAGADFVAGVGFWTYDSSSGYIPVEDQEVQEILAALGDDIEIELYAESDANTEYPEERRANPNDGLAARHWFFVGEKQAAGYWQVRAVWEQNNGIKLTSYVRFEFEGLNVIESGPLNSVTAVNDWLTDNFRLHGESYYYWVHLAPGDFEGYISVPNGMTFSIIGSGIDQTTLSGGIYVRPGAHGGIRDLTMTGAGSQHKQWPQMDFNGEKAPNYGIYGYNSTANFYNINFSGYYYAAYNADGFGCNGPGQGSLFRDNNVGICIDAADGVGGLTYALTGANFVNNDTAIELLSFHRNVPPSAYVIDRCRFIDNDVDVYNDSGRNFFMSDNYFYHEKADKDGSHNYIEVSSKNPGKDNSDKKDNPNMVYAYRMMNEEFTEYIYDADSAVPNSVGKYATPAHELQGKRLMVVDDAGTEDTPLLEYSFPETASTSSGGTARMAAVEEQSFDPSVVYERSENEIKVTINDIPNGIRPTVTVYCDGWSNAAVSHDGRHLASSFAGGEVSFTAVEGGEYVITRTAAPVTSVPRPTGPVTEGGASGWDGVEDEIADAQPGDTVTIDMNGETEVPGAIFEEIAGEDVTVEIDLGGGVSWSVNGTDVPEGVSLADLDLGVSLGTSGISLDVINFITGEYGSVQITLEHDGEFGFALTLTAPLGRENAGHWANLYHYDEARERLTFETSARIAADGSAALRMTHASQYAIVIDAKSHAMPFADVPEGAWYYDAVSYVYANGLMDGVSATTFAPDANMTRAMLVTILWRVEGEPVVNYLLPFTDVPADAWYTEAVRWAASEGIVTGVSDTSFAPNAEITREQLAAILHRYAGEPATAANLAGYADGASVSAYAVDAMRWCVEHGIITGVTDTTLEPQGTATRAQCATMLMWFAER